jgi:hypothetical protein
MLYILVAEQLLASQEGNSSMEKLSLLSSEDKFQWRNSRGKWVSPNVQHNFEGCKVYIEYKQIRGCPAGECRSMSFAT